MESEWPTVHTPQYPMLMPNDESLVNNRLYVNGTLRDCLAIIDKGLNDLWYGGYEIKAAACGLAVKYEVNGMATAADNGTFPDVGHLDGYVHAAPVVWSGGYNGLSPQNVLDYGVTAFRLTALNTGSGALLNILHLNNILYEQANYRVGSSVATDTATELADMKAQLAKQDSDMKAQLAKQDSDMKAQLAKQDTDMKAQLAELKALLTPECVANRLARAQDPSTNPTNPADPANPATTANDHDGPEKSETNIVAIVVPIVAVLLLAAIVIILVVMKDRKSREANAPPASAQANPAFNLATSLAAIETSE